MAPDVDLMFVARRAHRATFIPQAMDLAVRAAVRAESERDVQFEFAWRLFHDLVHGFDRSFSVAWFSIDGFAETALRTMPGGTARKKRHGEDVRAATSFPQLEAAE
jgi:hypothetical protein